MIGTERISDDTPLFKLTVGELKALIQSSMSEQKSVGQKNWFTDCKDWLIYCDVQKGMLQK